VQGPAEAGLHERMNSDTLAVRAQAYHRRFRAFWRTGIHV
jgi:hypothetical protein